MTLNPVETSPTPDPESISSLLQQRATIEGWLARLDSESGGANTRVVERVRADYQQRLQRILDELGQHLDALREQRSALAEALDEAHFRADQADEELDEARLRYRIGELDPDEWETRRPALEDAVAGMAERREEALSELAHLDDLLAQVEGGVDEPGAGSPPPALSAGSAAVLPPEEPFTVEAEPGVVAADPDFADPLAAEPWAPIAVEPPAPAADNDLAFLEDLDRAMAGEEPDTRPKPGVKCTECGYTNDPGAWYCGVCGIDLK